MLGATSAASVKRVGMATAEQVSAGKICRMHSSKRADLSDKTDAGEQVGSASHLQDGGDVIGA